MDNNSIKAYISDMRQNGFSDGSIKLSLLQKGYTTEFVSQSFNESDGIQTSPTVQNQGPTGTNLPIKSILIVCLVILVISGIGYAIFNFLPEKTVNNTNAANNTNVNNNEASSKVPETQKSPLSSERIYSEHCEIGPGITCIDFFATSAKGEKPGTVTIVITNSIGQSMNNLNIELTGCGTPEILEPSPIATHAEGSSIKYVLRCDILQEGKVFTSDLLMSYDTVSEGQTTNHNEKGYIKLLIN